MSAYQQTKYLDDIEAIIKRNRKMNHKQAKQFLAHLQEKKNQALAQSLLTNHQGATKLDAALLEKKLELTRRQIMS